MFCSAVGAGSRLNDWTTKPTRSRRSSVSCLSGSPVSSVSPSRTDPDVAVSRPARQCMSVDLPAPYTFTRSLVETVMASDGRVVAGPGAPAGTANYPYASGRAGLHQAGLVGEHDRLHPVAQAQLGQDPADVRLDRRLG